MTDRIIPYSIILFMVGSLFAAADEQLENGDFRDKLAEWEFVLAKEYQDKVKEPEWSKPRGEQPQVGVDIPYASTPHYARFQQPIKLKSETLYKLTYEVRGKVEEGEMRCVAAQFSGTKYKAIGLAVNVPVKEEWTPVTAIFKTHELASSQPMRLHLSIGGIKGHVDIRNVSLTGPLKDAPEPRRNGTVTLGGGEDDAGEADPEVAGPRTWTDNRGRKVTGTLKSVDGEIVELEMENGKAIKIPLSKLSAEDRAFVEDQ